MLSFFKKNNGEKPKLEGSETTVASNEVLAGETNETATNEEDIHTELSIHPGWNVAKEDLYSFQFLNGECPPLKPNQLSLSGISLMKEGNDYRVMAFVRNSLDKAIQLEETTLVLLGENDKILGRKAFNLQELGEIPARSSRPWNFMFTNKDLFTENLPTQGWKLAFQLQSAPQKHALDLEDTWKKSLSSADKKKLKELVDNLTPPNEGEVNFLGLQGKVTDNGDLHITLLIRNGSDKNVNLEQIPLTVEDAAGDIVAQGGFKLEKFEVKANTSKPWTFIFPSSLVQKQNPDLSRWKAYAPQQ